MSIPQLIVNHIRSTIQEQDRKCEEENKCHDSWDEEEGGAGWIENEVAAFYELYTIINEEAIQPKFSSCMSVYESILMLEQLPQEILSKLYHFIVIKGGTNNNLTFSMAESSVEEIRAFLDIQV
jgi:hypothetical protein